jgi:hypothetical protein
MKKIKEILFRLWKTIMFIPVCILTFLLLATASFTVMLIGLMSWIYCGKANITNYWESANNIVTHLWHNIFFLRQITFKNTDYFLNR